jgi:hypothetical protein
MPGQRSRIAFIVSRTRCGRFQPMASASDTRVTLMPAFSHLPIISASMSMRCFSVNGPSKLEPNGLPIVTDASCTPPFTAVATAASSVSICCACERL